MSTGKSKLHDSRGRSTHWLFRNFVATIVCCVVVCGCASNSTVEVANYPTNEGIASMDVDTIAEAIEGYIEKFHKVPPLRHQALFPLLNGENPLNHHFLFLDQYRKNGSAEVIDPWNEPYRIKLIQDRIVVSSAKAAYSRTVRVGSGRTHGDR
jgi:hypothetical protein